jgi:hypothetical protein
MQYMTPILKGPLLLAYTMHHTLHVSHFSKHTNQPINILFWGNSIMLHNFHAAELWPWSWAAIPVLSCALCFL